MSESSSGSTRFASVLWPRKRFKDLVSPSKASIDLASYYMLRLYRTNLQIRLEMIDEEALKTQRQQKIYAAVSDMLKMPPQTERFARNLEWDEIYKAERLIALLFSGAQLRQEISTRLQEVAVESLTEAETLRRDYETLLLKPAGADPNFSPDDGMLRMFLLRVLEAIHWSAKKKYLARPIRKEATKNLLWCLLVAFALLITPYVYLNIDFNPGPPEAEAGITQQSTTKAPASGSTATDVAAPDGPQPAAAQAAAAARAAKSTSARHEPLSRWWSLFALWTALTAGLLGAFFSRLISIQRQWANMTLDEVFLHREFSYSLLRAGVGVCGALIVYFFLRSGIVEGALFPDFTKIAIEWVPAPAGTLPMTFVMPSKALAMLTFWCFLAGFSEALVPSILSNTERQITDATSPTPAARR